MKKTKFTSIPASQETEKIVLGSMINNKDSMSTGAETLSKTDFHYLEHQEIFSILKEFYKNDKPADIHLIAEGLKEKKKLNSIGGASYLVTLSQYAGTSVNIEEYCSILKNKSQSREHVYLLREATEKFLADPENPSKISENFRQNLLILGKSYSPNDKISLGEILSGNKSRIDSNPIIEKLKNRQNFYKEHGKPFLTGLPTGFVDLDRKVTILEDTNFIVIAARPAMGKTAFALNVLSNICFTQNLPVGFISLEMGADQLAERILSLRTKVSGEKIKRGTFDENEYKKLEEEEKRLSKSKFFIHDQSISTVSQVISRARRLKDEEDIRILAVDYLQLLGTDSGKDNRQYEVAEVSRSLKQLAMELKIPVIVIAQLSRKVEERADKRPLMSDLRDSGQIEQDADAIIFIYRNSYYNPEDETNEAEIILRKNRHGPQASARLIFQEENGSFNNEYSSNNKQDAPKKRKLHKLKNRYGYGGDDG